MSAFTIFSILALIAMFGVLVVFLIGMIAMTKGQKKDHPISNKMMRLRVLFQACVILFLFLAYLAK